MRKIFLSLFMLIALGCFSLIAYGVEVNEETSAPRVKKIYLDPESEKSFLEKGKVKNFLGVSIGVDNNAMLNSARDTDTFIQTYFKTTFSSPLNKKTTGILEYEFMNLMYAGKSTLDMVNNGIYAGIDHKISKDINLIAGYGFSIASYFNSGNDRFNDNRMELKLKQKLPKNFYHSVGYGLLNKFYPRRMTRTPAAVNTDKERSDWRNTLNYEVGRYFSKDLWRLFYEYYNNNSNETYLKYYDYDSNKVGVSLTHLFNNKTFGYLSVSKQYRDYRSRTLMLDGACKEWDRTYLITSSLYYNINKSLTVGASYAYRENVSNEPLEHYSGSTFSVATYYKF